MINFNEDGTIEIDSTVDASSFYGLFAFGAYEPNDEKVTSTMQQVYEKLWCKTDVGGLARYENDCGERFSSGISLTFVRLSIRREITVRFCRPSPKSFARSIVDLRRRARE